MTNKKKLEEMIKKVLTESISEEEIKFFDNLKKNKSVLDLSKHYNVDIEKIIKELRIRTHVNRDMKKNVKKVWIDFTDTNSGINVKYSMSF